MGVILLVIKVMRPLLIIQKTFCKNGLTNRKYSV